MLTLHKTDSSDPKFIELVKLLDADLAIKDGEEHSFYHQYNKIDKLKHVIVAYEHNKAIGCGAIKEFATGIMEVKRMFTLPEYRGKGIAGKILKELELWAKELSYTKCILETGKRQPDAIGLYKKSGYKIIPNYGQYTGKDNSVCFKKELNKL